MQQLRTYKHSSVTLTLQQPSVSTNNPFPIAQRKQYTIGTGTSCWVLRVKNWQIDPTA